MTDKLKVELERFFWDEIGETKSSDDGYKFEYSLSALANYPNDCYVMIQNKSISTNCYFTFTVCEPSIMCFQKFNDWTPKSIKIDEIQEMYESDRLFQLSTIYDPAPLLWFIDTIKSHNIKLFHNRCGEIFKKYEDA